MLLRNEMIRDTDATINMIPKVLREMTIMAQCYKTFYCDNLPPFHGNAVILCYKAI